MPPISFHAATLLLGSAALLALAPSPGRDATLRPRAVAPAIVISSAEPDHPGWGCVLFGPALGLDPRTLPGGNARDYTVLPGTGIDTVSAVLLEAEQRGAAGCDTLPHFAGRPDVWEVAWYARATDGGSRLVRRTNVSGGALRCRALAHRTDPGGTLHTLVQVALDRIARLGGDAYAMGPAVEHGGPNPEVGRIVDRGALVRDARSASPLRDWDGLALDLCMAEGRPGRAVRLSATALPTGPSDACAAAWVRVPPAALRRALLAFLPRGPIELAARRPRRRALRDDTCGRYAIVQWDPARQVSSLLDDAYLTPLEMDSLARDVAGAVAKDAPAAARALRDGLGIAGPRPAPAPLAALRGVEAEPREPVALRLAPAEGGEFVSPIVLRLAGIPDSLLQARLGTRARHADDEFPVAIAPNSRVVSPATLRAVTIVLARAAVDDSTGCESVAQYPPWPPAWRATLVDADAGAGLTARRPRTLWTRRIRGRALEWAEHLPPGAEDDTRRVLDELVELGLPPARQFRGVGEDPPVPALPSIAERRESLLVAARTGAGAVAPSFLGLSFWFHGGSPHYASWSMRIVAGPRDAAPANSARDGVLAVGEASLRALLAEALDNPDVTPGAYRAREDFAPGDPYVEMRVVERRHAGNPTRLLYVSFLDRASGLRAVELLARSLAGSEPDAAAELRRSAQDLRAGDQPARSLREGS